jgi:hypothetical protein
VLQEFVAEFSTGGVGEMYPGAAENSPRRGPTCCGGRCS